MDINVIKSQNLMDKDVVVKRRRKSPHFITEIKRLVTSGTSTITSIFQELNFYIISDYFVPFSKNHIIKE